VSITIICKNNVRRVGLVVGITKWGLGTEPHAAEAPLLGNFYCFQKKHSYTYFAAKKVIFHYCKVC